MIGIVSGPLAERKTELERQASAITANVANLLDAIQGGGPGAKALYGRVGDLQGKLDAINAETAQIAGKLAASGIAGLNAEAAADLLARGIALLPTLPREDQAEVIRGLVHQVLIHADGDEPRLDLDLVAPDAGLRVSTQPEITTDGGTRTHTPCDTRT